MEGLKSDLISMIPFEVFDHAVVFIDAGHGWDTPGKQSFDGSLKEDEFNSAVQDKMGLILDLAQANYVMVSNGWKEVPLSVRAANINKICQQHKDKICIGVSLHADAFTTPGPNGITTFYYKKGQRFSIQGRNLAIYVNQHQLEVNKHFKTITNNRGVRGANFAILRETICPFILCECGFMTNPFDLQHLLSDSYRNDVAIGILRGIAKYLETKIYGGVKRSKKTSE